MIDRNERKPDKYYYNMKGRYADLLREVTNPDTVYQLRRTYIRENKSNLCPTLTANMGTGGHNVPLVLDAHGVRKLTPDELLRFQGFPLTFRFPDIADCHKYKQIGNSVTVPVVRAIAEGIRW